jgi:hypothetical protein
VPNGPFAYLSDSRKSAAPAAADASQCFCGVCVVALILTLAGVRVDQPGHTGFTRSRLDVLDHLHAPGVVILIAQ